MQRFIDALMLKGTWKPKPFHVVLLAVFLAYQGWMASPYFMHYVVGAPDPGSAPRHVGKLRVEGEPRRTGAGWTPPRYFLETRQGDVEFHCGYLPYKRECVHSELYHGLHPVEVGIHPYWGVDYMKLPAPYAHLNDRFDSEGIRYGRQLDLHGYVKRSRHFWAGCWLVVIVLAYVLLVAYSLLPDGRRSTHRVAKPTDEPGS